MGQGSMMNGLQTLKQWNAYFGAPDASVLGAMNAVYPIGKVCALFPVTWISDRYGRKLPMLLGFVLLMIGPAIQAASQNVAMFIVSRFIVGVATVFIAQPSPILITELAYPTHRGKITALFNTFFVRHPCSFCPHIDLVANMKKKYFGAIFAAWCTYGTFRLNSEWSWRIPSLLQAGLPAFQLAIFYWLPESPRYVHTHAENSNNIPEC
jgi:MFS family permease